MNEHEASAKGRTWKQFELPLGLSLFFYWAALPPLEWWPLAWLVPLPWILVVQPHAWPVCRPYLRIWLLGGLFWMAVLQGVRLAHWANYFGLLGLGLYFGAFWPIFALAARALHHRLRFPIPLAVATAWGATEWLKGQGPVGFAGAALGHTQLHWLPLIQVADLAGATLVSCLVMAVPLAAASACWGVSSRLARVGWGLVAAALLAGQVGYGWWRLGSLPGRPEKEDKPVRVALIQGSIDTDFGADPTRPQRMMEQYSRLTYEALRKHGPVDLVVWPESMFPLDAVVLDSDAPTLAEGYVRTDLVASQQQFDRLVRRLVQGIQSTPGPDGRIRGGTWLLLGAVVWHFDERESRRYNSALLFDPTGRLRARYDKMHPVLFGEYVPFGETFPWLYRLTPMSNGLTAGEEPVAFDVAGVRFSVSICFESIVPELIRRQVVELADRGETPDALINITNDGWFWGSSILDLQLHSAVFRAVENRLPMLVAANTGLSAWILPSGQVVAEGPRHDTGFLLAEVGKLRAARAPSRGNATSYHRAGDAMWIGAVGLSLISVLMGAWQRRRGESRGESGES